MRAAFHVHHVSKSTFERWVKRGRVELGTLLVILVFGCLCLVFASVAGEMSEGETRKFDTAVLYSMRSADNPRDPLGPYWFEETVRDVTSLGSTVVLVLFALAISGYLGLTGAYGSALLLWPAIGGAMLLSSQLKNAFGRLRPDIVSHSAAVLHQSFPSGHATMSAVTYLTLGALLARIQTKRVMKIYVMGVAVLLMLLVGVSRVYLGVHWPTDVIGGWCLGAAWAIACWLGAQWISSSR